MGWTTEGDDDYYGPGYEPGSKPVTEIPIQETTKEDWMVILRNAAQSDKEGWEGDPRAEPSKKDIDGLIGWFEKRNLLERLFSELTRRGWDCLSDLWEVRAALEGIQQDAFSGMWT